MELDRPCSLIGRHNIVIMSIFPNWSPDSKHLQLSRQNNGSPREVLILSLWTCEYIMWCSKKELKFQVELRLLTRNLKVGRVFWIIWMDPIQPEASLNEGKGCRRANVRRDRSLRKARLAFPGLKRGGIHMPVTTAAPRSWKVQENEFFLEPPEK